MNPTVGSLTRLVIDLTGFVMRVDFQTDVFDAQYPYDRKTSGPPAVGVKWSLKASN